jgi:hypothetical protein
VAGLEALFGLADVVLLLREKERKGGADVVDVGRNDLDLVGAGLTLRPALYRGSVASILVRACRWLSVSG